MFSSKEEGERRGELTEARYIGETNFGGFMGRVGVYESNIKKNIKLYAYYSKRHSESEMYRKGECEIKQYRMLNGEKRYASVVYCDKEYVERDYKWSDAEYIGETSSDGFIMLSTLLKKGNL